MNIAILGTRGIPNHYGGFEQFAQNLSVGLVELGHRVVVYNSHNHPHQSSDYNGVQIKHVYDPEYKLGSAGQFVYDFLSIMQSRSEQYDIIYQLGYTSSSIFYGLHPKKSLIVTNMDGLEWKRLKYSNRVRKFLKFAEKLAIKQSDYLISDSKGIQDYLHTTYQAESTFIPYGATLFTAPNQDRLKDYDLKPFQYNLLIARLERENSIEIILDGVVKSKSDLPCLIIGNTQSIYAQYLCSKYQSYKQIQFIGMQYDIEILNNLRHFSHLYFHGHTVGGTNPSLLEAMASSALIAAHDNQFNKSVLAENAFYFETADDVGEILHTVEQKMLYRSFIDENLKRIEQKYKWEHIISEYEKYFKQILLER